MILPKKIVLAGARPYFPEEDLPEILEEIADILRGGRLILGPRTRELESEWAERAGSKHAVALSSCTAALEIAYRYAKVAGREVIVPTNTFVATAAYGGCSAAPVWACWDGSFLESYPVQVPIAIHSADGGCDALFTETISVSLDPVIDGYIDSYGETDAMVLRVGEFSPRWEPAP